jgi:peptidoglycan hydrolase-like protein with peptidoglycan-binding domain
MSIDSQSQRSNSPGARYPVPSPTSLMRLVWAWEKLRALDVEGYRTSEAHPQSTWLVQIRWAMERISGPSPGRGTTCSPFTTQATAMAYSAQEDPPYAPVLADGQALPLLFSLAANSALKPDRRPVHAQMMARHGMSRRDIGWPQALVFFNMAYPIDPAEMRRGDAVHIDWPNGGGHAVFCWDVHLDESGRVDAFQFVSSNGLIAEGGRGAGVSVGGTPLGRDGFIRQRSDGRYETLKVPLFVDDDRYVAEGTWVTWDPDLKLRHLRGLRVPLEKARLRLGKRVMAARFHGVEPPAPYAMGGAAMGRAPGEAAPVVRQEPVPEIRSVRPAQEAAQQDEGTATEGQRWVEIRLKMLYEIGLLPEDNGDPDSINDEQTQAAVRAFQRRYGLKKVDGIAGPKTKARLKEVYEEAARTAAGQRYLATGVGVRGAAQEAPAGQDGDLYFRHGAARPGEQVALVLRGAAFNGRVSVQLRDEESGAVFDPDLDIEMRGGVGRALITVPEGATRLLAVAEGAGGERAVGGARLLLGGGGGAGGGIVQAG